MFLDGVDVAGVGYNCGEVREGGTGGGCVLFHRAVVGG